MSYKKKEGHIWCKYCEKFVVNNEACIKQHNDGPVHKVMMAKYKKKQENERIERQRKEEQLSIDLESMKTFAEQRYITKDVMKSDDKSFINEYVKQQDQMEYAKNLYGEDMLELMRNKKPQKIDKTETYNKIMKSIPSNIQKKYRMTIEEFKD